MKIKVEHYKILKQLIKDVKTTHGLTKLLEYKESLKNDSRVKDLDKRFRWDLFWEIKAAERSKLVDDLYEYMNDDHIDTALKNIVKEVVK